MRNKITKFVFLTCLIHLILFDLSIAAEYTLPDKNDPLIIGIFPRRGAHNTIRFFTPIAIYLERSLKRTVKVETSKDFKGFWKGVEEKRYDVVHFNQYHYVKSHKLFGYDVILKNEEFGSDTIAGSIVVRTDGEIRTIQDLRNKKIVFGGSRSAMQSYITATYLLRKGGLDEGEYEENFARTPPNAVIAVYHGLAAAGGAGDKVLKLSIVNRKIDATKMKYLELGEQLAHLPWAVSTKVPADLKQRIQVLLIELKSTAKGKKILQKAKLTSLNLAIDEEYDEHRKRILAVLKENYCVRSC